MKREEAKSRLIEAAGPVFADKGYEAATVREICDLAGMNVASVNYYFGEKQTLYIEAFHEALPMHGSEEATASPDGERTARERLNAIIHSLVARVGQHCRQSENREAWRWRLLARERANPTPQCAELAVEHMRHEFSLILDTLREILPSSVPEAKLIQTGLSISGQCMQYGPGLPLVLAVVAPPLLAESFSPDQIADHIWDVVTAALDRIEAEYDFESSQQTAGSRQ